MQQHASVGEVAELRLRLYRRDPPLGAVEAYLVALRDSTALIPAPSADHRPRRGATRRPVARRVLTATTGLAAVVGLCCAAVALGGAGRAAASDVAPAAAPTAAPGAAAWTAPPVPGIPLGGFAGDGAATKAFAANGHRVVVSVLCSGTGTLTLRIGQEAPVVLTCGNGGPALCMLTSTGALHDFTVAVALDQRMRWSLAAGTLPATR